MENMETTDPIEQLAEVSNGFDQQSVMDRLRSARQKIAEDTTLDLDVPGYQGQMVARYRLITNEELGKQGQKIRRQFKGQRQNEAAPAIMLAMSCDGLISANEGLFYRDDEGELHAITTGDGTPMTYSRPELAEFLQLTADSARDQVLEVFGGHDHDVSVVEHYMRVFRWMRDTGADVSGELLGEL